MALSGFNRKPLTSTNSSLPPPSYTNLKEEASALVSSITILKQMVSTPRNVSSFLDYIDKSNVRQLADCITKLKKVRSLFFFFSFLPTLLLK